MSLYTRPLFDIMHILKCSVNSVEINAVNAYVYHVMESYIFPHSMGFVNHYESVFGFVAYFKWKTCVYYS